jgi:hypothetical protein
MSEDLERAVLAYYRDDLGLSNRSFAAAFQIPPDNFDSYMNGDDSALTVGQKTAISNEAAHWVRAEDQDIAAAKLQGLTLEGVREKLGIKA